MTVEMETLSKSEPQKKLCLRKWKEVVFGWLAGGFHFDGEALFAVFSSPKAAYCL